MKKPNIIVSFLLSISAIYPIYSSAATDFDANYLYNAYLDYKSAHKTQDAAEFAGYVRGIATVLVAEKAICITHDFSIDQALDSVGELMENNPHVSNYPAAAIVADALTAQFACPTT